jgi:hypothetical protein
VQRPDIRGRTKVGKGVGSVAGCGRRIRTDRNRSEGNRRLGSGDIGTALGRERVMRMSGVGWKGQKVEGFMTSWQRCEVEGCRRVRRRRWDRVRSRGAVEGVGSKLRMMG